MELVYMVLRNERTHLWKALKQVWCEHLRLEGLQRRAGFLMGCIRWQVYFFFNNNNAFSQGKTKQFKKQEREIFCTRKRAVMDGWSKTGTQSVMFQVVKPQRMGDIEKCWLRKSKLLQDESWLIVAANPSHRQALTAELTPEQLGVPAGFPVHCRFHPMCEGQALRMERKRRDLSI